MRMHKEVDLDKLVEDSRARIAAEGETSHGKPFASFKPMRRKLCIPAEGSESFAT